MASLDWIVPGLFALMLVSRTFTAAKDPDSITGLYFGSASPEQKALTRASWDKWDVINSMIILRLLSDFISIFGKIGTGFVNCNLKFIRTRLSEIAF